VNWEASSSATATLTVSGSAPADLVGLDTETGRIDRVRWGAIDGDLAGVSGTIQLDDFKSWR
jgi:hypothetical protein